MNYLLIFIIFAVFVISNIVTAVAAASLIRKSFAMVLSDVTLAFIEITKKYGIDTSEDVIGFINGLSKKYRNELNK